MTDNLSCLTKFEKLKLMLVTHLWKVDFIRRHICWAQAVGWAFYGIWPIRIVEKECDYCGACKERE